MSKDIEKELRDAAAARGAKLQDFGGGHFQIIGDRLVNYYPFSKACTAYVSGSPRGTKRISVTEAVDMAFSEPPKPVPAKVVAAKVSNGFRKVAHQFGMQRGLCSICAGPMKLVNMLALSKQERKCLLKDPEAVRLVATIDHTIPLSKARGIDFNTRAAHKACNEEKGDRLIEPYPLPCYDEKPLPKIKLAPGVYLDMESA